MNANLFNLVALFLTILTGCSHFKQRPPDIIVLAYADFGPARIATPLIGNPYFQWQAEPPPKGVEQDVYIVVYNEKPLWLVQRMFPVIPEKRQDYRYLRLVNALQYLDSEIARNHDKETTETLLSTRNEIAKFIPFILEDIEPIDPASSPRG